MTLAGYSALIYLYDLKVPVPDSLSAISQRHKRYKEDRWTVYTIKYKPDASLIGHLTFALKYEGVNLLVLKKLFESVENNEIEEIVEDQPTSRYSRRIWFFYEWLTGEILNLPDVTQGNYVDALDSSLQYAGPERRSRRHRVRNNLPGNKHFCPLIRRTEKLETMLAENTGKKIQDIVDDVSWGILGKTASFLQFKDARASHTLGQKEGPFESRSQAWEQAISQAGKQKLTADELLQLQEMAIEDQRFVAMGWRKKEKFAGIHNPGNNEPLPDHIGARWQDIPQLMQGLIASNNRLMESAFDPVLSAAVIAFGFVFIHPFADGNGRIHRYLIHHVLAEKECIHPELIFPISAVILENIEDYNEVLTSFSKPRLDFIDWEPTPDGNIEILNDTIDLYRYFDATKQAEFLYDCVKQTVAHTLPGAINTLEQHARMRNSIKNHFNMSDKDVENLIRLLHENNGIVAKHHLPDTFQPLTGKEISMLEEQYRNIYIA